MEEGRIIKRKRILFAFIMLFLLLPMIQQKFEIISLKSLKGSFSYVAYTDFSVPGWFDATFQSNQEEYLKERIGFRSFFVRINNQIDYSFSGKANANNVLVGKDDFLFSKPYISTYLGGDYVGDEFINDKLFKLKEIKDTLFKKNIDLIVVIAPGKGSFYPEYFPESFRAEIKSISNYEAYIEGFNINDVYCLDFNEWFKQLKDTSIYPLYPKNGIHWSAYGEYLAADSIIGYIEFLRDIKLPQLELKEIELSSRCRFSDQDIEDGMNLLFDIPDLEMAYPIFEIVEDENTVSPKVLTIADSFYWGMFGWGMSTDVFDHSKFWYYNKQIYPDNFKDSVYVDETTIISEVEKNEVIMLMSTDRNLFKFAFGFIDQVHRAYFGESDVVLSIKEKRILEIIKTIKSSPNWLKSIEERALLKNISLEEAIRKNAVYVLSKEDNIEN